MKSTNSIPWMPTRWGASLIVLTALLLAPMLPAQQPVPDLTAGGAPTDSSTITLGPTGLRGWAYAFQFKTDNSRQILIKEVEAGSPADGILAANDVILGVDGTGAAPVNFTQDARKSLAYAIGDAEARDPATLKLLRWRAGVTETVEITLQTLGAYSPTAPYDCPKSAAILEQGLQYVMNNVDKAGTLGLAVLPLMAADDPSNPNNAARQAAVQQWIYDALPSQEQMDAMNSNDAVEVSNEKMSWDRGHKLIVLCEYYLKTNDAVVLPYIDAYVNTVAKGQSFMGTVGHQFAKQGPDGSFNGPYGIGYGPVNSAGVPILYGLVLAKRCGNTNPRLDAAIERAKTFFGYYAGKGSIPYGEHVPGTSYSGNGKSGLAAIAFEKFVDRQDARDFYARLATASGSEREAGHTGYYFNALWTPLGAAVAGQEAVIAYFSQTSWQLDLCRRWDSGFDFCKPQDGTATTYGGGLKMYIPALLTYALPHMQLEMTGRSRGLAGCLSSAEIADAAVIDSYVAATRTINELLVDLGSWAPQKRLEAAVEIGLRASEHAAILPTLHAMASDTNGGDSRVGACLALAEIRDDSSLSLLVTLLTDSNLEIRRLSAIAIENLSQAAKLTVVDTILQLAVSTAQPLFPINPEDPMHLAHTELAAILFHDGSNGAKPGALYGSIDGVDRNLLYPAIRALAASPHPNGTKYMSNFYQLMTDADFEALADVVVDGVYERLPLNNMANGKVRIACLEELDKRDYAEAVPLSIFFYNDSLGATAYDVTTGVLNNFAGTSLQITPDPQVLEFLGAIMDEDISSHVSKDYHEITQALIDLIHADTSPAAPKPLKSIQSVTADDTSLTLPENQTTLRVAASDLALGDLVYTWRKVRGAGNVSFTPNGTDLAKDTVVLFNNTPGNYLFEVTVSDSRGLTDISQTVEVTLLDAGGILPPNAGPTAYPQTVSATRMQVPVPITLSGSDPEGLPLLHRVVRAPALGFLSGTAPDLIYKSNPVNLGTVDDFVFEVIDSEGQTDQATITINIDNTFPDIIWVNDLRDGTVPAAWNALLTGAGYTVTGFVGQATPTREEEAYLNAASLIIYGTGNDGASTRTYPAGVGEIWNRLRPPLIQMDADHLDDWELADWNKSSGSTGGTTFQPVVQVPGDPIWNGVSVPLDAPLATGWRVRATETLDHGGVRIAGDVGQTAIARWAAGTIPTGTHPGGERMFFAGSSTFGDYTLTALGERVFLNAIASIRDDTVLTSVPRIVGFSQAEAEAAIVSAQLLVGTITLTYSDTIPEGEVISQNPEGTILLPTRTFVDLVISAGPHPRTTVPDVVGLAQATSESDIAAAQLTVGKVTLIYNDTVAAGHVISQSLTAGTVVLTGTSMDLVVSAGIANIQVSFQEGVSPTAAYGHEATYIRSKSTEANNVQNGDPDKEIIVGSANSTGTDVMRGLLEFDIRAVPATANLTSVSLILTTRTDTGGSGSFETFNLHSYARDIDETKATWNKPDAAGADVPGGTLGTPLTSTSFLVTQKGLVVTFNNTPNFRTVVAEALAGDGYLRLMLKRSVENTLAFGRFVADSSTTPANRPKLVIEYKPPNVPPAFVTDPIQATDAMLDKLYGATLAGTASDINGDPLSYAKTSGPGWLLVAADGTLSGIPTYTDVGDNAFTVSVSDGIAQPVTAILNIAVHHNSDAPVLVGMNPTDNATGVATDTGLTMTFNKDILANGGFITLRNNTDGIEQTIATDDISQVSITGTTLMLQPVGGLEAFKEYTVLIDYGAVQDLAGNAFFGLSDPGAWNFTTSGPTAPYDIWAGGTFARNFIQTDSGDNPDADTLSNLLEFAFGTDPTVSDASPLGWGGGAADAVPGTPVVAQRPPGAGGAHTARFMRRVDHGDPGSVTYAWRFSPDLSDWESSADEPGWLTSPTVLATDPSGQYELVEVAFPTLLDSNREARFFQVILTQVP